MKAIGSQMRQRALDTKISALFTEVQLQSLMTYQGQKAVGWEKVWHLGLP